MKYAFWGDQITQGFILLIFSHQPVSFNFFFILLYYMHLCKPPHILCGMRQGTVKTKILYSTGEEKQFKSCPISSHLWQKMQKSGKFLSSDGRLLQKVDQSS